MSRRPEPRRTVLNGEPVVVLTPAEYERLAQARRQIGGQSSRLGAAKRDLKAVIDLLADVVPLFSGSADCSGECPTERSCLRCRIHSVLTKAR